MVDTICDFVFDLFGSASWIAIIIIAMVPIIELRGAIPIAFNLFANKPYLAYALSVLGSTLPALVIIPLLIPFFAWLKKRKWARSFAEHFENKFKKKGDSIKNDALLEKDKKRKDAVKFWGVACFVAIPLPLTGSWTGSAVAAYLGLDFKKSIFSVFIGNMISGAIMTCICLLFPDKEEIILLSFLALVVVFVLGSIVLKLLKKKKVVEEVTAENIETEAKTELELNSTEDKDVDVKANHNDDLIVEEDKK